MSPHFISRRSVVAAMSASTLGLPGLASAASGATAPEFTGIEGWLNSGPLTMHGLRGRVVLVNFFARSCINCIHAMPAIKSWYGKYRNQGFVVVGVHTPEFDVEKSRPALEAALARYGLTYPVAQDNTSATWNAYSNQYWPAEYLVDQSGRIVHQHFGEGGYAETERLIQGLLQRS